MTTGALSIPADPVPLRQESENLGKYYLLFFISGFPALIYQIVWQRTLFTIYGVNIESVTVIVAIFMFGLGIGSLSGGWISTRTGKLALRYFGFIECSIGVYGLLSLRLFRFFANFTAGGSTAVTALDSFALLLVPTLLMGSTLPLLVAHLVHRSRNVGESVGALYSANAFGSSAACFCAAFFLMRMLGESGSVLVAASMNFAVGGTALVLSARFGSHSVEASATTSDPQVLSGTRIRFEIGMTLAVLTGFLALAYEVLWYRVFSFASGGSASCFAKLLGFYLLGLSYGAFAVQDACKTKLKCDLQKTMDTCSKAILIGTLVSFLVGPAASILVSSLKLSYELTYIWIAVAAGLLGAAFPLLCHAMIDPKSGAGKETSYLYLANVVGSVMGSILVGFVIFDHFSISQTSFFLLVLGLGLSVAIALTARRSGLIPFVGFAVASLAILIACRNPLFGHFYERLLFKNLYSIEPPFKSLVENRSGVIAVSERGAVYGGGIYDGYFNIDPANDENGIFRAYAIPALHSNPKRVLIIGLSSGSWAQILTNAPMVQDVTIVEINPGYLPLIRARTMVASLLSNPKVHLVIDDGRRWLVGHPDRRFDFILMNTTFHWRANVSNMLSVEFLQLARQHLDPGGILYYNTTESGEVQRTGATVFPYALRVGNFLAVSDTPIFYDRNRLSLSLLNYRIDGRIVFDQADPTSRTAFETTISMPFAVGENSSHGLARSIEGRTSLLGRLQPFRLITDDNMGTEWR